MMNSRHELPDPTTAPELFEGVLPRRIFAYIVDVAIMGVFLLLVTILGTLVGFFTFGIGWLGLVVAIPAVILGYYATTLGSAHRATIGMRVMDLVLTPTRGAPLDGWRILIHPVVFWISWWVAWPISLAIALFTPRREMVHDLIAGTLMVRRSPMERHWRRVMQAGARA